MKKKVLIIVGPTASGKSDLAIQLAKLAHGKQFKKLGINGAEIISADSRQVYKGLNIGSGKITKPEMQGVKHHLLDVANPKKQFSASDFVMLTNLAIAKIVNNGKLPIVVGGTGFYIDALTGATTLPEVPPNKLLRSKLNKLDKEKLFKMLKKKDPKRAKTIDKNNKVRMIRALEIIDALGQVPPYSLLPTPYSFTFIGLKPDNIDKKIRTRLEKRLPGIIREIKRLHNPPAGGGLSWKRMFELGLEYRYISLYVQGKLTREEAVEKLFTEIRRYAKRQMTYWKKNRKIKWFEPNELKEITQYLKTRI